MVIIQQRIFLSEYRKLIRLVFRLTIVICVILVSYILIYVLLSVNGGYQPSSLEYGGRIGYSWAPLGFYTPRTLLPSATGAKVVTGGWKASMVLTFYPLWMTDICYIHKSMIQ